MWEGKEYHPHACSTTHSRLRNCHMPYRGTVEYWWHVFNPTQMVPATVHRARLASISFPYAVKSYSQRTSGGGSLQEHFQWHCLNTTAHNFPRQASLWQLGKHYCKKQGLRASSRKSRPLLAGGRRWEDRVPTWYGLSTRTLTSSTTSKAWGGGCLGILIFLE